MTELKETTLFEFKNHYQNSNMLTLYSLLNNPRYGKMFLHM
jgi:hypothetical protein